MIKPQPENAEYPPAGIGAYNHEPIYPPTNSRLNNPYENLQVPNTPLIPPIQLPIHQQHEPSQEREYREYENVGYQNYDPCLNSNICDGELINLYGCLNQILTFLNGNDIEYLFNLL